MSVTSTDIWVSAGSLSAPFYRFYTDSSGTTELTNLILDPSNSYTFRRLNAATTHPFYLKASLNSTGSTSNFSLSGDGNTSVGITGNQSLTLSFSDPNQAPASVVTYCTAHPSMQSTWSINQAIGPEPTPEPTPEPEPTEEVSDDQVQSIDDITTPDEVSVFELKEPIAIGGQEIETLIVGTNKKDKIIGTSDGEIIAGQEGKDVLKGMGGPDGFLLNTPNWFGNNQSDIIKDFDHQQGDSILVDKDVFGLGKKIKLKVVNGKKASNKASKSNKIFVYDEKKGLLYFNENGRDKGWGDGGLFAKLQGAPELGASDFTIV